MSIKLLLVVSIVGLVNILFSVSIKFGIWFMLIVGDTTGVTSGVRSLVIISFNESDNVLSGVILGLFTKLLFKVGSMLVEISGVTLISGFISNMGDKVSVKSATN